MANPVFARAEAFNGAPTYQRPAYGAPPTSDPRFDTQQYSAQPYGNQPYGGQQYGNQQYGTGPQGFGPQGPMPIPASGRITVEDVITKTGITLLVVMAVAVAAYRFVPYGTATFYGTMIGSSLIAFVTVLIVSMRRTVSPVGVLFYAVVEGAFIGVFTRVFEMRYPGIAVQAVLGTFAAAAATLAAYRGLGIKITDKFRRVVVYSTLGFAVAMLVNLICALCGVNLGLRSSVGGPVSFLPVLISLVGAVLAVLNLLSDFDYVERAVAKGAPESESWRAALGFTVTMVWLYTELLRILSYFRR